MTFPGFSSTLGVLRYTDCYRYIEHALGGPMSTLLTPKDVVDQAGEHLVSLHPWSWLGMRSCELELRPRIMFTDGSWNQALKRIQTVSSPFIDYTPLVGDTVNVTLGDGTTNLRRYLVDMDQAPTPNTIFLTEDIGAADGFGPISATLDNNTVRLPEVIRDARSLSGTDAVIRGLNLVTVEELLGKRTAQLDVTSSWNFYGAITFSGTPPRPILEIWPGVVTGDPKGLTMFYRVGWLAGVDDDDPLPLPSYMFPAFIRLVRIFALGYEEGDESGKKSLDQALAEFHVSPILQEVMSRDGAIQPSYGPLRGGGAQRSRGAGRRLLGNQVDAPS